MDICFMLRLERSSPENRRDTRPREVRMSQPPNLLGSFDNHGDGTQNTNLGDGSQNNNNSSGQQNTISVGTGSVTGKELLIFVEL